MFQRPDKSEEVRKMREALSFLEAEGGKLNIFTTGTPGFEKIQAIVFTTAKQLADLKTDGSNTDVCLLDITYGCCAEKYKTAAIVYPCPRTGGTRVACTAVLVDETSPTMAHFLQFFRDEVLSPKFFFVDKDFGQLEVLRRLFPSAIVLLCAFHVIKYLANNVFPTLHSTRHRDMLPIKRHLFKLFKRLVNSTTQSQFDGVWQQFKAEAKFCTIRSGKSVVDLVDYMDKNWIGCQEMWARHHRRAFPIRFTYTTNRFVNTFTINNSFILSFPELNGFLG